MPEIILVIEQDAALLATLGDALRADETVPVLARGAPEAMQELERGTRPDAIVIDLDMPDGLLALAQVECATEDLVPVVALSSRPGRLLEAGIADAVVMKPFEVARLRTCVARACGQCRGAL